MRNCIVNRADDHLYLVHLKERKESVSSRAPSQRSQPKRREEADVGRSAFQEHSKGRSEEAGWRRKGWKMFRGQTWSTEEVQTLISIWSDETMAQLLASTHKNRELFKLFSEKMAALGFHRSVEQCRIKVKKLRLQYFRVRDAIGKSGTSAEEKEKFVWYEELDGILGSRPSSRPKALAEPFKEEAPWTPTAAQPADLFHFHGAQESIQDGKWDWAPLNTHTHIPVCIVTSSVLPGDDSYREVHPEEDESTSSSGSHRPLQEPNMVQWTVPGGRVRKRKRKTDRLESFLESYMQQKRRMDEADQKRRDEEKAAFESFLKMQQEAEERQLEAMAAQQRASSQLLLHMMGTLVKALLPQSEPPHPPATMADPRPAPPPQEISGRPGAAAATSLPQTSSALLSDINTQVVDKSKLFVDKEAGSDGQSFPCWPSLNLILEASSSHLEPCTDGLMFPVL